MIYEKFVEKIIELDSSNTFAKSELKSNPFHDFYNFYDPRGVEFKFKYGILFMIPYKKIEQVTKEYGYLEAEYVFATCDGDPYFVKKGKVYTCCHGTKKPKLELIAGSFEEFLEKVIKGANKYDY